MDNNYNSGSVLELSKLPISWFETTLTETRNTPAKLNIYNALLSVIEALPSLRQKYWVRLFGGKGEKGASKLEKRKINDFFLQTRDIYVQKQEACSGEKAGKAFEMESLQMLKDLFTLDDSSNAMKLLLYKLYCRRVDVFDEDKFCELFGKEFILDIKNALTMHAVVRGRQIEIPDSAKKNFPLKGCKSADDYIMHLNDCEQAGDEEILDYCRMTTSELRARKAEIQRRMDETTVLIKSQQESLKESEKTLATLRNEQGKAIEQGELAHKRESLVKTVEAVWTDPLAYDYIRELVLLCVSKNVSREGLMERMMMRRNQLWYLVHGSGTAILGATEIRPAIFAEFASDKRDEIFQHEVDTHNLCGTAEMNPNGMDHTKCVLVPTVKTSEAEGAQANKEHHVPTGADKALDDFALPRKSNFVKALPDKLDQPGTRHDNDGGEKNKIEDEQYVEEASDTKRSLQEM